MSSMDLVIGTLVVTKVKSGGGSSTLDIIGLGHQRGQRCGHCAEDPLPRRIWVEKRAIAQISVAFSFIPCLWLVTYFTSNGTEKARTGSAGQKVPVCTVDDDAQTLNLK